MTTILDGQKVANDLQNRLQEEIHQWGKTPKLAVILVGNDPASEIYVRNKKQTAEKVGIATEIVRLPLAVTQADLLAEIKKYNEAPEIDGLIVQLPLPKHLNEQEVILAVDPKKDVDGFHPVNMGQLFLGSPKLLPATPYGIKTLLDYYHIPISGKQVVIVGRSNIVGKPMAHLLLNEDATVTITHSKTKNLKEYTKKADILIVAIGEREFITKDYIKKGAVVVDVGMNRNEVGKLTGDVAFQEVAPLTSFITPVPKGVGPMTIISLLQQTFENAKERKGK